MVNMCKQNELKRKKETINKPNLSKQRIINFKTNILTCSFHLQSKHLPSKVDLYYTKKERNNTLINDRHIVYFGLLAEMEKK